MTVERIPNALADPRCRDICAARCQRFRHQSAIGCQASRCLQRSGFSQKQKARKPAREPRKARPSVLPIQAAGTAAEARSKRSRCITLFHAATKSFTNFSLASAQP